MSKKRLHTKRTTLHFVVGNEQRFPLLLGTNNALRIFLVLSETKSALLFFSGDMTKISGNMTQVSGDMTSGDLTVNHLLRSLIGDCLALS